MSNQIQANLLIVTDWFCHQCTIRSMLQQRVSKLTIRSQCRKFLCMLSVQYNLCIGDLSTWWRGLKVLRRYLRLLGYGEGDAAQAYFLFIKLIGKVIFDSFPLINECDIMRKMGATDQDDTLAKLKGLVQIMCMCF